MASTGTAIGPQEADGTVHQPEAAAGADRQHSGAQFRQEGASLSETGQAAGIKGSGSTAAGRVRIVKCSPVACNLNLVDL